MDDYGEVRGFFNMAGFFKKNLSRILYAVIALALVAGVFLYAKQRAAEREATARVLLEEAKNHLREEEIEQSLEYIDAVFADYSETGVFEEALLYRARVYIAAGDPGGASACLERYIDEYPEGEFLPEVYSELGFIHEERGELSEAENFYSRVFRKFPGHYLAPKSMADAARCLAAVNEHSEAARLYETLLSAYPWSSFADTAERELENL